MLAKTLTRFPLLERLSFSSSPNFPCLLIVPHCQINSTESGMETLPQEPELLLTGRDVQSVKPSVSSMNIQRNKET